MEREQKEVLTTDFSFYAVFPVEILILCIISWIACCCLGYIHRKISARQHNVSQLIIKGRKYLNLQSDRHSCSRPPSNAPNSICYRYYLRDLSSQLQRDYADSIVFGNVSTVSSSFSSNRLQNIFNYARRPERRSSTDRIRFGHVLFKRG